MQLPLSWAGRVHIDYTLPTVSQGIPQLPSVWRQISRLSWWPLALFAGYFVLVSLHWMSGTAVEAWDDAHFFKRIGLHILEQGTASWNLGEGPVYGNTSQLFQLISLLPLLLAKAYYMSAVKIILAASSVLLFFQLSRSARRLYPEEPLALGLVFLAASSPLLLLLMHSGMETIPALAILALNLYCVIRNDHSRPGTVAVVLTTVLVYLIRPDALIITVVVCASYYLLEERKLPWRLAIYCALALGVTLLLMYLYFGTAFPLSFHLKSRALTTYSEHFANLDMRGKRKNIISILLMAAPLLYVAGHGKGWWRTSLVLSVIAFISFHYLSTVEIMSYRARFYLPVLVPLTYAASASAQRFRERSWWPLSLLFSALYLWLILYFFDERMIWVIKEGLMSRVPRALYLSYGLGAALLLVLGKFRPRVASLALVLVTLLGAYRGLPFPKKLVLHSDEVLLNKQIVRYTTVRGIKSVRACLAQPLHIYHTEIGVPGLVFDKSVITDLAGLMDREIASEGLDFDRRCLADMPELIFLPHRNYKVLRSEIAGSRCIQSYTRVVKESSSPLYLRSDLLSDFLECSQGVDDRWIDLSP